MYSYNKLLNKPVVYGNQSKIFGNIDDIIIDADNFKIIGILVNIKSYPTKKKSIIGIGDILFIEKDFILIRKNYIQFKYRKKNIKVNKITGKKISREDGQIYGRINDIFINKNKEVESFLIEKSIWQDVLNGRNILNKKNIVSTDDGDYIYIE